MLWQIVAARDPKQKYWKSNNNGGREDHEQIESTSISSGFVK
jgi:hypothetical protein